MDNSDIQTGIVGIPRELIFNLLELTWAQKCQLQDVSVNTLTISQTRIAGIETVIQLRQRIAENVHWNTLCTSPVTTAYLNRLFGRVAHRLDSSVGGIIEIFLRSGRFMPFVNGRRTAVVSTAVWNDVQKALEGSDAVTRQCFMDNWAANMK